MRTGDTVATLYGLGRLRYYRETDGIYVIDLFDGSATLYCTQQAFVVEEKEPAGGDDKGVIVPASNNSNTMQLNVAYEALDKMRRLNLELLCQERGITDIDYDFCATCLLNTPATTASNNSKASSFNNKASSFRQRSVRAFQKGIVVKKCAPCLICGTPACRQHSSASFRKEGITMCSHCETLFGMEFVVDCLTANSEQARRRKMDELIELYDRALLLLKFSGQYVDEVAMALEQSAVNQNKVGLGSSSAGIVSGVLGVAAAATIFTPAGPPLLIASLLFGGSATAVQTGADARNYFSEPNQLADRIIALHGTLLQILRVAGTLRDALLRDHLRTDVYHNTEEHKLLGQIQDISIDRAYKKHRATVLAGMNVTRYGALAGLEASQVVTAAEGGAVAARNARFFSRGGTAAMRTMRFARFAGGTLAAATLVLEARCMASTIQSIRDGSPSHKADTLRSIKEELETLPKTKSLDSECDNYLQALADRRRAMTEQEVTELLLEQNEEMLKEAEELRLREDNSQNSKETVKEGAPREEDQQYMDFFQEEEEEENDPMSASLLERIEMHKRRERESLASSNNDHSGPAAHHHRSASSPQETRSVDDKADLASSALLLNRIERQKRRQGARSQSPPPILNEDAESTRNSILNLV